MAYQEETARLTTWLRMEVVQVHAAAVQLRICTRWLERKRMVRWK